MKKFLRGAALAAALLGSSFGLAWMGNVNVAEAYSYDLDGAYDGSTDYPEYLNNDGNTLLAYTHSGNGFYVDMSSVYCIQQSGSIYYLAGNVYCYNMGRGSVIGPMEYRYKYDTNSMYIYVGFKQGQDFVYSNSPSWTSQGTSEAAKAYMSLSKLMWKAYSGEEWTN